LVVWAYRREVKVAREFLGVVEDLEEGAHAPACCAECSGCGLVCFLNCTWTSGAVEPLLSLQASCVLVRVICLQYRLQLRSDLFAMPWRCVSTPCLASAFRGHLGFLVVVWFSGLASRQKKLSPSGLAGRQKRGGGCAPHDSPHTPTPASALFLYDQSVCLSNPNWLV
jgi:hypothetical protein